MIYDLWFLSPGACFPMIAAWCNVSSDKSTVLSLGTVASRLLYLSLTWEKLKIFYASLGPSSVSSAASLSLPLASQAASPHSSHLLHLLCICSLTPAAALTSQLVWVDLNLGADAPPVGLCSSPDSQNSSWPGALYQVSPVQCSHLPGGMCCLMFSGFVMLSVSKHG